MLPRSEWDHQHIGRYAERLLQNEAIICHRLNRWLPRDFVEAGFTFTIEGAQNQNIGSRSSFDAYLAKINLETRCREFGIRLEFEQYSKDDWGPTLDSIRSKWVYGVNFLQRKIQSKFDVWIKFNKTLTSGIAIGRRWLVSTIEAGQYGWDDRARASAWEQASGVRETCNTVVSIPWRDVDAQQHVAIFEKGDFSNLALFACQCHDQ